MKRPSRARRESATTMRKAASFLAPTRLSRMTTAMRFLCLREVFERAAGARGTNRRHPTLFQGRNRRAFLAEPWHPPESLSRHAALAHLLDHLLHAFEVADEHVHRLHGA